MQQKLKAVVLFLIAAFLFILGNRKSWDSFWGNRKVQSKNKSQKETTIQNIHADFQVQQLEYDTAKDQLFNRDLYFQTMHLGDNITFEARKPTIKVETGNKAENASESI